MNFESGEFIARQTNDINEAEELLKAGFNYITDMVATISSGNENSDEKMKCHDLETLPIKGVYTLILFLPKEIHSKIGKLGTQRFPRGYYTYTGSALGIGSSSLKQRLLRHLKKEKRKFWHIDFLLGHKNVHLTGLVTAEIYSRVECQINLYIKTKEKAEIPIPHFGASDCKRDCRSHLLYFGEEDITKRITTLYNEKFGIKPITVNFSDSLSKGQNPLSSCRK